MRWEQVNLVDGFIKVDTSTKTKRTRDVPIMPVMEEAFARLASRRDARALDADHLSPALGDAQRGGPDVEVLVEDARLEHLSRSPGRPIDGSRSHSSSRHASVRNIGDRRLLVQPFEPNEQPCRADLVGVCYGLSGAGRPVAH